ncbi:MAG: ATP-binding cassette domain-containing protein [Bacteroidaceae bacterium]|nr:ATP-binding cassette domain-containing protein [Bacteroidaceae bacterium]
MAVYIDQIKKRRQQEQAELADVYEKTGEKLGLQQKKRAVPQDNASALRQVLDALNISDYELEDDGMQSPEEQLTGILRPRGIMMRDILLTDEWWRECVGPLLGYAKDGRLVALTPTGWGLGYQYREPDGTIRKVGKREMAEELQPRAITFTKALPLRPLKIRDFLRFAWSVVSGPNALLLLAAALVVILLGMFTPMANKLIFDTVIPTGDAADLVPIAGLLLGATLGTLMLTLTRNLYIIRIQHIVELHTQNAVMARTFLLSPNFFSKNASGELTAKLNNITTLSSLVNETVVGSLLSAMLSTIYLVQVYIYGKQLFGPALLIILSQAIVLMLNYRRTVGVQQKYTERAAKLSGLEYNMFAGIQKLKLTGAENRAFTRWLDHYGDVAQPIYNPAFTGRLYPALIAFISLGGMMLLYWTTLSNGISPSDYIAFSSAFGMITATLAGLNTILPNVAQIQPLLESVQPILEAVPEMEDKAPQVEDLFGGIEVSGVSFRYQEDGPMILDDLSLKIEPGEYVGIVGKSGCGKSTLMRLLLGFEQPISGGIYYDNYDLSKVDKASLRRKIGCCLQSGSLFTGDLFHNITITAPWASHDDAWEALRMACLEEDVRRMPMGLHTVVSEGGGGFSGGQKQRILIARALISKPDIIFFDEATSALDNISQKAVSENLDSLMCTRVVIAHRLSTIRHCDRIIVLDKGKIAEQGTFEELMENKGLFYEMSLRQL